MPACHPIGVVALLLAGLEQQRAKDHYGDEKNDEPLGNHGLGTRAFSSSNPFWTTMMSSVGLTRGQAADSVGQLPSNKRRHQMSRRTLTSLAATLAMMALTPGPVTAQTQPGNWTPPRTASGAPDLQGVWDFRSLTPMERPTELGDTEILTEEEAAGFAGEQAAANAARDEETPYDTVGNYNQFWFDYGSTTVETNRTSLVVDPPNGRIPALTPAGEQWRAAGTEEGRGIRRHTPLPGGFVEDLGPGGLQVRCILGFNSGPPLAPGAYNNNLQLIQTADHVVLLNEMVHNARIVPLDGRPHIELFTVGG